MRTTSGEFFDKLVTHRPDKKPEKIVSLRDWITDQFWYFRYWRFDPTIVSALNMLQALHERFAKKHGLYARLTDEALPAITFQLLDLKHFGLSDDLYIKMNARGKPLTAFETFKAGYEQKLAKQFSGEKRSISGQKFSIAEFVARRMDTAWADFFWVHREDSLIYDDAVMNLFRGVALVSRDPGSKSYLKDATLLRSEANPPSYSTFNTQGWLDEAFTRMLISLLEVWSATAGLSKPLLPDKRYFDEKQIFLRLIEDSTNLSAPEVVLFSGYALFIQTHEANIDPVLFQEWMRVVHNLAVNSDIDRTERLQNPAKGLRELLPKSTEILQHLSKLGAKDRVSGFTDQQVKEETLKAGLILSDHGWRPLIERAEGHGYFRGQIEFLCEFSGASEQWQSSGSFAWEPKTHRRLQKRFEDYLAKAEAMFTAHGLMNLGDSRWQRALLSFGDYLLPSGSNWSFLVSSPTDIASWKRFLGGTAPTYPDKRPLLKQLWDQLADDRPFSEQLDDLIAAATGLEPWLEAFVRTTQAMEYCKRQLIRWNSGTEIYLLSTSQMNGFHAELFTYCLYHNVLLSLEKNGSLKPLKLSHYQTVKEKGEEPYIRLNFKHRDHLLWFWIEFKHGRYYTRINRSALNDLPELHALLCGTGGFVDGEHVVSKFSPPEAIKSALDELARLLSLHP